MALLSKNALKTGSIAVRRYSPNFDSLVVDYLMENSTDDGGS